MFELNYSPQLALPEHISNSSCSTERVVKDYYTAKELREMNISEIPMLVEGVILQSGIMVLSGSSDVGKSTFLRHLALSVASCSDNFLGWKIHARHNKVIFVSTEDDSTAISYLLNKTIPAGIASIDYLNNIRYVFDPSKLLKKLDKMLTNEPADCIIIDAFGDIYGGEINQVNKVREFMNKYSQIVEKHNTAIIFIHHNGKRTEGLPPSKNNMIGSQGIEGKARQVIELRKDPLNSQFRHLCIVKGNYIPEEEKQSSYKLKFNEDLSFENTNERVDFDSLIINPDDRKKAKAELGQRIVKMKDVDKMTYVQIAEKLKSEGEIISKTSANNIYIDYKKKVGAS